MRAAFLGSAPALGQGCIRTNRWQAPKALSLWHPLTSPPLCHRPIAPWIPRGPRPLLSASFLAGGLGSSLRLTVNHPLRALPWQGDQWRGCWLASCCSCSGHTGPFAWHQHATCQPRLPRQVLGRWGAGHAAGTQHVTASLIYLPRIKQTPAPALNGNCSFKGWQKGSRVCGTACCGLSRDCCLAWLLGTSEATLGNSVAVP